ncbi:MAG TPA: 2-hydroxychromene-2-carboxylate isomerase [Xanthomonadaceae bacterium]|jgi:2-hydroxychromene-2-carboxylate isomerase
MSGALDWYFDVISPFAYLQWVRLRRDHPEVLLRPRPVLFGALLQHHGQLGPAEIPGKRAFTYRFVAWEARRLGIELRFPPAHPFNPVTALRLILAAADTVAATDAVFAHIWRDGRAADSAASLREVAGRLGITDVEAAVAREEIKLALRTNTEEAIARGVFGVPTLRVGQALFWGNDATGMALDYLADPEAFAHEFDAVAALPVGIERRKSAA